MTDRTKDTESALQWYADTVAQARKLGMEGNVALAKLDRDGGELARRALQELKAPATST